MNLVESYLTKNPCYTNNVNKADSRYTAFQKTGPQGLMLHSVGCNQPSASVFLKNWNSADCTSKCVHGFIDANDGTVYQTLPWNYRGWHAGGDANNTHVGVEMCEPAEITYGSGSSFTIKDKSAAQAAAKRTYEAAVELFAYLCEKYSLDPTADGVIISHAEGYKLGVASNHADPQHLWTGLGLSYTMDTFRAAVKAAMNTATTSTATVTATNSDYPDVPFTVQVLVSDLNYRSEPSMSGTVKGQTGKGTFTITKVSGNWGYLKSGAGWIYLANADYVTIKSTVSKTYAVGDKVTVNGKIYGNGDGSGGTITKSNATMYVVNVESSSTYKYYIGVAAKKGGTRQGWTNPDTLS